MQPPVRHNLNLLSPMRQDRQETFGHPMSLPSFLCGLCDLASVIACFFERHG